MFRKQIVILIVSFVLGAGFLLWIKNKSKDVVVHYHAGFKVYLNGNLENFAQLKYMEDKPCTTGNTKSSPKDPQMEKAHLHDLAGDVVHVHAEGGTWADLFKNMKYSIPEGATVSGYLSGTKIENFLSHPIKSYESLIITVGDETTADLTHYVTVDRIKEVEQKSESCGAK